MRPTLTDYLIALIKHPNLSRADPTKAAQKYGIKLEWAEEYLRRERERRGWQPSGERK